MDGDGDRQQGVVRQPYRCGPTALPLIQSDCQAIIGVGVAREDSEVECSYR